MKRNPTQRSKRQAGHSRTGFTLIECAILLTVASLLCLLAAPVFAQLRGEDQRSVTAEHLRQYARAHLHYIADHDVLPPLGTGSGPGGPEWVTEVGVFNTDHNGLVIDVPIASQVLMNSFVNDYVADPIIFTSPADSLVRYTDPGDDLNQRLGNFLTPTEDPQAIGATFSRLWFGPGLPQPEGYVKVMRRLYVEIGGLAESKLMSLQRADTIESPSDCVDLVEEDEESTLNNSIFAFDASMDYPFDPGTTNLITDRHPGEGGHVSFYDGHVELLTDIVDRYWDVDDGEGAERLRLLWRTAE